MGKFGATTADATAVMVDPVIRRQTHVVHVLPWTLAATAITDGYLAIGLTAGVLTIALTANPAS